MITKGNISEGIPSTPHKALKPSEHDILAALSAGGALRMADIQGHLFKTRGHAPADVTIRIGLKKLAAANLVERVAYGVYRLAGGGHVGGDLVPWVRAKLRPTAAVSVGSLAKAWLTERGHSLPADMFADALAKLVEDGGALKIHGPWFIAAPT